jgi:hypothetical protein
MHGLYNPALERLASSSKDNGCFGTVTDSLTTRLSALGPHTRTEMLEEQKRALVLALPGV